MSGSHAGRALISAPGLSGSDGPESGKPVRPSISGVMLQPGDMSVDLTLAVNYVPAALCLLRVLVFTTGICLIGPGEELGGYQLLGLVLYLDRVILATYTQRTIFDSNAVLAAVFFSNIYSAIRASVTDTRVTFMTVVVNLLWVVT